MSSVLPAAALCCAAGLTLGRAPRRALAPSLALLLLAAGIGSFAPGADFVPLACWISVIATAACAYLPVGRPLALILAANAGLWSGAVVGSDKGELMLALPFALVSLLGAWLVADGKGVALKVAASWLLAVAVLAAALPTISTPASAPDHME